MARWFDPRLSPGRHLLVGVLAVAGYLASDLAAALFEFWPGTATLYIPAAVAVGVLVGFGPGHVISVLAAMLIAAVWPDPSPFPFWLVLFWATAGAASYALAAWILREKTRFQPTFATFGDGLRFAGVFLVASLVVSFLITFVRQTGTEMPDSLVVAVAFWIGDFAAILAITPFILIWILPLFRSEPKPPQIARDAGRLELLLQALGVGAALLALAFGVVRLGDPILFMLFVPMLWIAARSGVQAVVVASAVLTMGAAAGLAAEPISHEPALIVSSVLVILSGSTLLLGASLEERARAELNLGRRGRHLARAEELAGLGSWVWDSETSEYSWSDGLYAIHGVHPARPVTPWEFLEYVATEDRERVESTVRGALARVEPFSVEYTLVGEDGRHRRVAIMGEPEANADGEAVRVIGTCQDLTEVRLAEQESWKSRRMEALGELAAGVAHDFNNYLMVINGSVALLGETEDPQAREDVRRIEQTVVNARELNYRLLAFARGGAIAEKERLDINREIEEHAWIIERILGPEIELRMEAGDGVPDVFAYRAGLEQILNNLVTNAREAASGPGSVSIRTSAVRPSWNAGSNIEWAAIEVRDDGQGMSRDVLERIFDPFYTTKASSGGSGIGLATVRRVVEELGGFVDVESEIDVGTSFALYLPPAELSEGDL